MAGASSSTSPSLQLTASNLFVLLVAVVTIVANVVIILVVYKARGFRSINKSFFLSLTTADLILGVGVFPFCFLSDFLPSEWRLGPADGATWIFGDVFCHVEAYLATICFVASIYSLMWISVDHYIAIRKPERYDSIMTHNKAQCWILFVWAAAFFFCCPPLFGYKRAFYSSETFVCLLDWTRQRWYFVTSMIVVAGLPIVTLSIVHGWMFTESYRKAKELYEKTEVSDWNRTSSFRVSVVVGLLFVVMWGPWCLFKIVQDWNAFSGEEEGGRGNSSPEFVASDSVAPASSSGGGVSLDAAASASSTFAAMTPSSRLDFPLMWFALCNSFAKFFVYLLFSAEFRFGLKTLFGAPRSRSRRPNCFEMIRRPRPTQV